MFSIQDDDCGDQSDEPEACNHGSNRFCPKDFFRCVDGSSCIPSTQLCDGSTDCSDASDENVTHCDAFKHDHDLIHFISSNNASFLPNGNDQKCPGLFSCKNGGCVSWESLCNGQNDCGDYSDEAACNVNECENPYTCAHICNDKKIGYECQCHPGFRIRPTDPSMCDDIDECLVDRPCSQLCINTPGTNAFHKTL